MRDYALEIVHEVVHVTVVHVTVVHWRLCDVPIVTCRKVSRFGVLRLLES